MFYAFVGSSLILMSVSRSFKQPTGNISFRRVQLVWIETMELSNWHYVIVCLCDLENGSYVICWWNRHWLFLQLLQLLSASGGDDDNGNERNSMLTKWKSDMQDVEEAVRQH